jgi:hypothetical protein
MDSAKIGNVTALSTIYKQQAAAQPPAQQAETGIQQPLAVSSRTSADTVQVNTSVSLKNLDTSRAIEQMHASLNQLAKGVRETNESVNKAVEVVGSMKNSLQGVIKNYPPFPIDSKERNERLMEYTSLRKELLSLMAPPPPPAVYEKVKRMWSSLFDESTGSLQSQAVPPLENGSSDAQLKETVQTLDKTTSQLGDLSNSVTQALLQP